MTLQLYSCTTCHRYMWQNEALHYIILYLLQYSIPFQFSNKALSNTSCVSASLTGSGENPYSLVQVALLMYGVQHWCWKPT